MERKVRTIFDNCPQPPLAKEKNPAPQMFPRLVPLGNHLCCGLVGAVIFGLYNHFEGISASGALCEHTAKVEKHTLWFNRGMCPTLGPRGKKSLHRNHAGTYVGSFKIVTCRENALGTYDTPLRASPGPPLGGPCAGTTRPAAARPIGPLCSPIFGLASKKMLT